LFASPSNLIFLVFNFKGGNEMEEIFQELRLIGILLGIEVTKIPDFEESRLKGIEVRISHFINDLDLRELTSFTAQLEIVNLANLIRPYLSRFENGGGRSLTGLIDQIDEIRRNELFANKA
jgi:hypothetical protein